LKYEPQPFNKESPIFRLPAENTGVLNTQTSPTEKKPEESQSKTQSQEFSLLKKEQSELQQTL
jgi:hypothetical protein